MNDKPAYTPISQHITRVFNERRIRKSALSRVLGVTPATITNLQGAASMGTERLWQLCLALRHNFFADVAAQLPSDFGTNAPKDTSEADRIAELEKEVEKLNTELGVWEKMGRKF